MIESLDILRKTSPPNRIKSVFLLTDGVPNVEPPRGHKYMLEKYMRENNFKCPISFYGFGYNLQSDLLSELSDVSGGDGYSFIPDASLLGNVFIHGLSNLFITAAQSPVLNISLTDNVSFTDQSVTKSICIDSLKYGKSKNFMFQLDTSHSSRVHNDVCNAVKVTLQIGDKIIHSEPCIMPEKMYRLNQLSRHKALNILDNCIRCKEHRNLNTHDLDQFVAELTTWSNDSKNEYLSNILFDFQGQVREALDLTLTGERERWFQRWGKHYLLSLKQAYKNEICNNFKDKGVSNFGGVLFDKMRDEVDQVFASLPPPKADIKHYPSASRGSYGSSAPSRSVVRRAAPPVNMAAYNNAAGGCCGPDSHVMMYDNSLKKASAIKKGDKVLTYSTRLTDEGYHEKYSVSEIECVVKTYCDQGRSMMVHLGELMITPYHPVIYMDRYEKDWCFPISINEPRLVQCPEMYTFVVRNRQHLKVERFVYATLGHNCQEEIVRHDYFGTDKVINDLKKFNTYEEGYVHLTEDMFHRGADNKIEAIYKRLNV